MTHPISPVAVLERIPVAVQLLDRLGEIVGVVCITVICLHGRLSGEFSAGAIAILLGVQTGLRAKGQAAAAAAASIGAIGVFLMMFVPVAHAFTRTSLFTLFAFVLVASLGFGCASGPVIGAGAASIAVRAAWPTIHRGAVIAGLCDDEPPGYLVGTFKRDAGVEAPVDAVALAPLPVALPVALVPARLVGIDGGL